MKKHKGILFLFSILLVVALAACTLPTATPTSPVGLEATMTSLALTQRAGGSQDILTATETSTPTITPTLPPSVPVVSVSLGTNCRTGPGVDYDYITALLVGEKAEVVGKYTSVTPPYWIIKKGSITCWLWGKYATVEGDTSGLPEMAPPPTSTPTSTPAPTDTPTPTATTPPPPPAAGDIRITDIFQSTGAEVIVTIVTSPNSSLSGNFQYTVDADTIQVAQGSCSIPAGSNACWTGYIVSGTQSIQVDIDSNGAINETDEGNNSMTMSCNSATKHCSP